MNSPITNSTINAMNHHELSASKGGVRVMRRWPSAADTLLPMASASNGKEARNPETELNPSAVNNNPIACTFEGALEVSGIAVLLARPGQTVAPPVVGGLLSATA